MRSSLLFSLCLVACMSAQAQTIIGTTTYDVQTNNGHKHRIIAYPDGQISALWTGSFDPINTFTDRGMFYTHNDGVAWGVFPTERVEDVRTGFGEIVQVMDHELVVSHDNALINIRLYENAAIGDNAWTESAGSQQILGVWPSAYCEPGTNTLYIVNMDAALPTELRFSRSDDGGASWSVLNYTLPFLTTADGFPSIAAAAENYQVVAHGPDVYVLFGIPTSDLVLLHSDDYGNDGSWESNVIIDFPYDNYTGTVQSDLDGDGITDTINTADGSHNMIITDDGTVHVFSPLYRMYSDAGAFGYILNQRAMGMWHWTNGMPAAELIDTEIDWVNDDCADDPFAGIGAYYYNYRSAAVASSPGSAWDPLTGRIYLIYALKIEYTDIYDDPTNFSAESFHDLFGMYSDDDGATWSQPVNLTNNADEEVENYFVFTADRVANGKVHIVWQQDDMPGHFNEGDPITTNNIRYAGLDPESFIPVMPDANFSSVADIGDVTFTNLSTNASGCYFWDFGDGGTSNEANPEYTYTVAGTYSVCLTASNPYGTDTYCDDVIVALPPDAAFTYSGDPIVNFTDLTLNDPTSWSWDFGDGGSSTLQNPVHTFTADATYTVCLTATNALGFEVYCLPIVIDSVALLAPTADFSFTISGLTMSFTDLSTNDPDTWAWDFGDGGTSTEQNPSHAFPVQANYTVCLTASNAYGGDTYCIDDVFANGIHDMQIEEVEIYPNPSTGAVQIALPVLDIDAVNVYDIAGKQMSVNYNVATGNVFLHAEQLAQGNYFVRIYAGDKMYIGNLVKQ